MEESSTPRRPSRRTVAKGAAWTVPAIAVVSPTPAMAASPGIVTLTGQNCKIPGNSANYKNGAVFLATISNTTASPITIVITSFTRGGVVQPGASVAVTKLSTSPASACCTNLSNTFVVPANSSGTYAFVTNEWPNSANTTVSVAYNVDGVPQPPATATDNSGLPPIAGGSCGEGGSCTSITEAQRACIMKAIGNDCPAGNCS